MTMEQIMYERVCVRVTERYVTRCPYRRGLFVGSHSCFFCKHCKGRTEDTVSCSFKDFYKPERPLNVVSMDVMVDGHFRRTIYVKPTGYEIIKGVLHRVPTEEDIRKTVKMRCPMVYRYEKWNVEFNL